MMAGQEQKTISLSKSISRLCTTAQELAGKESTLFYPQLVSLLLDILSCYTIELYLWQDERLYLAAAAHDKHTEQPAERTNLKQAHQQEQQSTLLTHCQHEQRLIELTDDQFTRYAFPLHTASHRSGVLLVIYDTNTTALWELSSQDGLLPTLEAIVSLVALLLEQFHQRNRDHDRIKELSLLNSISRQMNSVPYEIERVRSVVLQRVKEITDADFCALLEPTAPLEANTWVSQALRDQLSQDMRDPQAKLPIVQERGAHHHNSAELRYFSLLPEDMHTFFVLPLLRNRAPDTTGTHSYTSPDKALEMPTCIIGGYRAGHKMRPSELSLLQVLAHQAGSVLENVHLIKDVIEARNQARKLLKQVLDDQRQKELILSTMPSGLITTDERGCIRTFNHAAERILGYRAYDVLTIPLQNVLNITFPAFWLNATSNERLPTDTDTLNLHRQTITSKDRYNREVILDVDIRPFYDEVRNQPGLLIAFSDMTSVHRLEDERRRLDHLAFLGEMAASVAHEVRNPLASIKMSMQLLRDELIATFEQDEQENKGSQTWMHESINVVLQEVERLDAIVRDLLLFARPRQLHRSLCEITQIIEQVLRVVAPQCSEQQIEVHRGYEPLPALWIDSAQMEQIVLNIVMNAIQAMPEGGILSLSYHLIPTEQAIFDTAGSSCPPTQRPSGSSGTSDSAYAWLINKHATQKEFRVQHWLELLVSDTGSGIAAEQLPHIFQPFYTTKAHGIGLGLAITRRLVEDHGGYLRIESQPNYGSTIAVRIPFVAEANLYTSDQTNLDTA